MTAAPHFHLQPPKGPSRKDGSRRLDDVRCAIQRSVDFYRRVQLPHGEFQTQIATTPDLAQPEFDSSPFTTTFVLYALSHLERNSVRDLTEPALRFLRSEQELGEYGATILAASSNAFGFRPIWMTRLVRVSHCAGSAGERREISGSSAIAGMHRADSLHGLHANVRSRHESP